MTTAPAAEPLRLSPSRISLYQQCPLRYRYRYLDDLPDPPTPATLRGTLVHAVLERLFDLPTLERTPAAAHALVAPEWARILEEDPDAEEVLANTSEPDLLRAAHDAIDQWYRLEDPTRLQPAAREIELEAVLPGGVLLHGFIDRLDAHPTVGIRINDYKTSKRPAEPWQAKALQQPHLYALMYWRAEGVIPAIVRLIYLADGRTLEDTPTPRSLTALEQKVVEIADQITHSTQSGEWPTRKSKLCDWCPYAPICPAQRPVGAP